MTRLPVLYAAVSVSRSSSDDDDDDASFGSLAGPWYCRDLFLPSLPLFLYWVVDYFWPYSAEAVDKGLFN